MWSLTYSITCKSDSWFTNIYESIIYTHARDQVIYCNQIRWRLSAKLGCQHKYLKLKLAQRPLVIVKTRRAFKSNLLQSIGFWIFDSLSFKLLLLFLGTTRFTNLSGLKLYESSKRVMNTLNHDSCFDHYHTWSVQDIKVTISL